MQYESSHSMKIRQRYGPLKRRDYTESFLRFAIVLELDGFDMNSGTLCEFGHTLWNLKTLCDVFYEWTIPRSAAVGYRWIPAIL